MDNNYKVFGSKFELIGTHRVDLRVTDTSTGRVLFSVGGDGDTLETAYNKAKTKFENKATELNIKVSAPLAVDLNQAANEDMLGPMDSPTFNMSSPGQTHQTPGSIPSDMDIFSLTGPGKKKKKKKDKDANMKVGKAYKTTKVLSFIDFLKDRK